MLWWNGLILLIVPIKLRYTQTRVQTRKNASFPSGKTLLHSIWSKHGAFKSSRLLHWAYLGCSFPRLDAHRSQASSQLWHVHFPVLVGVQFGEQLLVSLGAILGRGAPAAGEKQLSHKLKHSCTETEERDGLQSPTRTHRTREEVPRWALLVWSCASVCLQKEGKRINSKERCSFK